MCKEADEKTRTVERGEWTWEGGGGILDFEMSPNVKMPIATTQKLFVKG